MKDLFKKIKPFLVFIFAFIGGAILPYAFAPYNYLITAIISPGLLLWCLTKQSPASAFLIGWCYGLGMFGFGVNWVYVSIHDYGYTSEFLATIITGLFVALMGLYPAFMSYLLNKFFNKHEIARSLIIYPALWTIFEILRGWVFTGFPWLFVGYSQMGSQLRMFAPIGGVFLVSWVTVLISSILYAIITYYYEHKSNTKLRNSLFASMIIIWVGAFGASQIKWTKITDQTLNIALVQGNIAQLMRWDPIYVASIIHTYQELTQRVLNADLIVWPEGAIPVPLPLSQPLFKEMGALGVANHFALISGVPSQLKDKIHYYNSLIAVGQAGSNGCETYDQPGCIYYKEHLVPFGEYVPLDKILRGLIAFFNLPMSSFVSGPDNQSPLLALGYRFAPAICYEIAYPFYVQKLSQNADFILTVSNDTWFGTSIGPAQHLQIAQFRALETGKYVIRATNTGFTAIIEPDGKLQTIARAFEANILRGHVSPSTGDTFWIRFGYWPLALALCLAMLSGYLWQTRKKKK
ncbi:MAG: apolipoprotein N-acyltransferase [Proteobacteria bacterium]|nr:apolipoprotein N-acyltransferase [Pseudomonadota bacterium]